MAAENKTGELSFPPAGAQRRRDRLNSTSQTNSHLLLSGVSVDQHIGAGSLQTPTIAAAYVQTLPTVHVSGLPFTIPVCMSNSVTTTTGSFSPYKHHTTLLSPASKQGKRSVSVSPVLQQSVVVGPPAVPAVHQVAQPATVLEMGNNGVLNAVLGRLPNIGTMVVHSLDPGSLAQKNIVAMIDGVPAAVTTAAPVINLQPVLTLSYQGTMASQPPKQASVKITQSLSQASALPHTLPPVIISRLASREPPTACSLAAQQPIAFAQSSVNVVNVVSSCTQQLPSVNLPVARPTVLVRTLASSSGQKQLSFLVSAADSTRFPLVNSAQVIPPLKLPVSASSRPGAVMHYHTTAMQTLQHSPRLATQSTSHIQPSISLPVQTQLVVTVPTFVASLSNNVISESSHTMSSLPTLPPSESLTTIVPPESVTIPFQISQSDVNADVSTDLVRSKTQSPLIAASAAKAAYQTSAHATSSLIQTPTCTNNMLSSSVLSASQSVTSYVPASSFYRFNAPLVTWHQQPASCLAGTKKHATKRPPRKKKESVAGSVFQPGTNTNVRQMLHSTVVGRPAAGLTRSVAPLLNSTTTATSAGTGTRSTLMAGVKRKCVPAQKYTLLLENGRQYSSVYFDGKGFSAKKPAVSFARTAGAGEHISIMEHQSDDMSMSSASSKNELAMQPKPTMVAASTAARMYCGNCNILNSNGTCMKCARPLQSVSQFVLLGASATKPLIVLPTPASFTAVSGHPSTSFQPRMSSNVVRTYIRKPAAKKPNRALQKREPEVVHILSSDDEEDKAVTSVTTCTVQTTSTASSLPATLTFREMDVGKKVVISQHLPVPTCDIPPLSVRARVVRIGSIMLQQVQQCTFFVKAIRITFTPEGSKGISNLPLLSSEMRSMFIHFGPQGPVVFLLMSAECGKRICNILGLMGFRSGYYDPESTDDSVKYVTIIPVGSVIPEIDMKALVSVMQSSCEQSSKFVYRSILAPEAEQLLNSIHKSAAASTPVTTAASTVVKCSAPVTTMTLPAARLLVTKQPGSIGTAGQPVKIIVGSMDMLRNLNACMQGDGRDEEAEMDDRSRSPSPPHPIFSGPVVRLFTYPPPPATGGIAVTNEDFYCLNDGEFLNDVIIDFYLKYLLLEVLSDADRARTHIFSSFFYRRLTQKQTRGMASEDAVNKTLSQRRHLRVKTWTRHVDLFKKDFVIVPINESAHWYLAIVCFAGLREPVSCDEKMAKKDEQLPSDVATEVSEAAGQSELTDTPAVSCEEAKLSIKQPCILIFDSLMSQHYGVVRTLREYLQEEWNARKRSSDGEREFDKDNMKGCCVKCPQQSNFSDCGIYVLQYAESFFTNPITNFSFPFTPLVSWFPEAEVLKKRETLRQLVLTLKSRLNPDLQYDVQQGSMPSAPVMPQTSVSDVSGGTDEDAALLNPIAADSDTYSAGLLQTGSQQSDMNEHKPSDDSEHLISSVPDQASDCVAADIDSVKSASSQLTLDYVTAADAESVAPQIVSSSTTVTDDEALGTLKPSACHTQDSEVVEKVEISVSDDVCQVASFSSYTAATELRQHISVLSVNVLEPDGNKLVADVERGDTVDASMKPCQADEGSHNPEQVSDTLSCVTDSISHCVINESFVGSTADLRNSAYEQSVAESEHR